MVDDPALYNHLVDVTAQLDTVLAQLHSPHSSVGRLLTDDTLYTHMVAVTSQADSLLRALSQRNGTAGRIINDPALYDKLNKIADGSQRDSRGRAQESAEVHEGDGQGLLDCRRGAQIARHGRRNRRGQHGSVVRQCPLCHFPVAVLNPGGCSPGN